MTSKPKSDRRGPVIIKRTVRYRLDGKGGFSSGDVLTDDEREVALYHANLAVYWVRAGRKLPRLLKEELAKFAKRIETTDEENLLLSRVNAAYAEGHPLSISETGGKESAFSVVARELELQPKTVEDNYYRIEKLCDGEGLPLLANAPKRRKVRK